MECFNNPFVGINNYLETEGNNNPWLASATYEEKDEYRFKGRKEDTSKILSMLQQNECVVCYAASGDGKSSLVNAGLCPAMRRIGLFPIKITFSTDEYNGKGLPFMSEDTNFVDFDRLMMSKINQAVENYRRDFITTHNIDGDYDIIFEKISKYENVDISDSLWWKLRTETIQIPFGVFDYIPVLIFDQFEEIFRATWKAEFFRWLENLMKETCPNEVAVKYNGSRDDLPSKRLFKLIFSMRYEFIGELDYWCSQRFYIPQLLKDRYFLRALNLEQAKQVIVEQSCGDEYALSTIRDKANEILKILSDERNCGLNNTPDGISAILLSILCYTYYKQIIKDNNTDLPSAKDLVKVFYNNICKCFFQNTPDLISLIERALVTSDGKRNRIRWRNVHELDVTITKNEEKCFTIGDILLLTNLIRKHDINNEEYIEFAHDKIAEVVKEKLDNEDIKEIQRRNRKKNIEKRRNLENVLTVSGRELFNNQFYIGESNFDRIPALSSILQISNKTNSGVVDNNAYMTSIAELLKGTYTRDSMICLAVVDSEFKDISFKDGVYFVSARLIDAGVNRGKVEKVRFLDRNKKLLCTRNGYCGINLKYDKNGNETSRVYVDENQMPTYNTHCYAEIRREYDPENNTPLKTRYYSPEGNPCAHFEGNYGFDSMYNEDGNEIRRIFVDALGNHCPLINGIYGQELIYSNNQLIYVVNLDKDNERTADDSGCISIEYIYEKDNVGNQYLKEEINCDKSLNKISNKSGYCILKYSYDSLGRIEYQDYCDEKGNPIIRTDGYSRIRIKYDDNGWPIIVSYHDIENNYVITEGASIVKRIYDEIGLEKEIRLLGPDGAPMYNKDGVCLIKIEYNRKSKLPESHIYCNHKGEIALTKDDRFCKVTKVWDKAGRYYINETHYSSSPDKPYEILTYEWLSPFEFFVKSSNDDINKHIKWNILKLPSYEEDLLGQESFHHKCMLYNDRGWLYKELYYNEDNTPYYDELGDAGTEYLYDESGQACGNASLDADGMRRVNSEGWSVIITKEKFDKSHVNTNYFYYDTDGSTPVLTKSGYHRLVNGDDGYRATYDIEGKPVNDEHGIAKCKVFQERDKEFLLFYNQDGLPACKDGCHKIVREYLDDDRSFFGIEFYDKNGVAVDIDGFSKRICKRSGFWSFSTYTIEYFNHSGNHVDGPNPLGQDYPIGCKFYLNTDKIPYYAISANGKIVVGSYWSENIGNIVLLLLIPLYYLLYKPCNWLFTIFARTMSLIRNQKAKKFPLIVVKNVVSQQTTFIANLANILPNDIVLSYGEWNYANFEVFEDAINSFKKVFNEHNNVYKQITIGRVHEDDESEPETSSFWVPANIGVQLYDEVREDASGKIEALLRKYKNTYNS